ncbi:MAG TPA: PAS domain S-box protein [Candidatus Solibacter sp.]|nr:PAS domain S-box protein [Candidatus Solibacter sp.]
MSSSIVSPDALAPSRRPRRGLIYAIAALLILGIGPFLIWPTLMRDAFASDFLPHLYCYLGKPGLVWTHVAADSLIGMSYVAISVTLAYLIYRGRRDIPFHWMFLAFGLFIIACGGTHFVEVITIWNPIYVFSAGVKIFTALVSVLTAVLLPVTVPRILNVVRNAKTSEENTARLRVSESRLSAITETATDAIISANSQGNVVYFNSAAVRIFGYSAAEASGQPLTFLMPERFHTAHKEGLKRFLATREARVIGKSTELVGRRRDGAEFPLSLSLSAWDAGGETFFTAFLQDITERKTVEDTIRQSEERFRLMVSEVKDYAILMLDLNGHIVSWNTGAEQIKGYRTEEIIGQHFSRFYTEEDIERGTPQRILAIAAKEGRTEDEGWRVRKDGSRFWANVVITAVHDKTGQLRGFAKLTRDMTEQKNASDQIRLQNAQLAVANKELEAFSYSVSHDLRTPLRAIDGFSLALLEDCGDKIDGEGKRHLQRVRAATVRMGHLIDDLLQVARISRSEMGRDSVNLSLLAEEVAAQMREAAPDRHVAFVIAPGLMAQGDRNLLRIVLENLLSNSWKFTARQSHPQIEFGMQPRDGEAVYFVRDNGVGFDMQYATKLFGVFQRLHSEGEFPGTGIGLATVQRIVHRHGGRIWVEASVGKGAAFYFVLNPKAELSLREGSLTEKGTIHGG